MAFRLAQLNQRQIDQDYPGLIEQYNAMLAHQHRIYDEAIAMRHIRAAEYEQIQIDTSTFATQVQGALSCLERTTASSYDHLREAWVTTTSQLNALRNDLHDVSRDRQMAAERQAAAHQREIDRLKRESNTARERLKRSEENWKSHLAEAKTQWQQRQEEAETA